jgi:hypothetical protein
VKHWDGISRSRLGQRDAIGGATVERWFQDFLQRQAAERSGAPCPRVLGIDEHFFTRRQGYATTFCDLKGHKIFDVVLGRSEKALESYLERLPGKDRVRIVCMDLASVYRALVRKHFPKAKIVADRFHVIRLINHHFLACWREIDPTGAKHRGLLSLMRRHRHNLKPEQRPKLHAYFKQFPAVREIYRFKQRLCYLLLKKHRTRKQCVHLATRFLKAIYELRPAGLAQLVNGLEKARDQGAALFTRAMLFQQQIAESLFVTIDLAHGRELIEVGLQLFGLAGLEMVAMPTHQGKQTAVLGSHRVDLPPAGYEVQVDQPDDMKPVGDDAGIREMFPYQGAVGAGQIHAYHADSLLAL